MTPDDTSPAHWRLARRRPVRWCDVAPEALLVIGLTIFLIDEPDAATSAFKSGRALAIMAVAAIVWLAGRLLAARLVPWRLVRLATFTAAAVAALAVVVLPAYDDDTVVEAFPSSPATAIAPTPAGVTVDPTTLPPTTESAPAPTVSTAIAPTTAPVPTTPSTSTVPAEPTRLRSGPFIGIDHRASGTVAIYRAADGRLVVGLESFDIQPGPDYDVYVVPGTGRDNPDGGTRLDDLRGNQGTQYYEVPAGIDIGTGDWTVLVWCQTFGVPVANATPA